MTAESLILTRCYAFLHRILDADGIKYDNVRDKYFVFCLKVLYEESNTQYYTAS